jgi:2-C-methyl-D-erythritol 4-phosphate cytidylyltransferase
MAVSVVLVAAGAGTRFSRAYNKKIPKQFHKINGEPLIYWTLRAFQKSPVVKHIVVVTLDNFVGAVFDGCRRRRLTKVKLVIPGGRERFESTAIGVQSVPGDTDVVLVHDAARPLITADVIARVARAARKTGAALAAWPLPDTLKRSGKSGARVLSRVTVPRENLWLAQTPQGFKNTVAQKLFRHPARLRGLTDDVQAAERAGQPVEIVLGSARNIKVTYSEDLKLCALYLKSQ